MALHPNSGGPSGPATHRSDPDHDPRCDCCGTPESEGFMTPDQKRYLCAGCAELWVEQWAAEIPAVAHNAILDTAEWAEWVLMVAKAMTPGTRAYYKPQIRAARLMVKLADALED